MHTKASVILSGNREELVHLKAMAILFDKVECVPYFHPILTQECLEKATRDTKTNDIILNDIDFFHDTSRGLVVPLGSSLPDIEFKDVFSALTECGALQEVNPNDLVAIMDETSQELRDFLIYSDIQDEEFVRISGASPSEFQSHLITVGYRTETGKDFEAVAMKEPTASSDSYILTTNLFWAEKSLSSPIFLNKRHRQELSHRYTTYYDGLKELEKHAVDVDRLDFTAHAGEVLFQLGSKLLKEFNIQDRTPEDIIKFRESSAQLRQRYVTMCLRDLGELLQSSPWDSKLSNEVEYYVQKKLIPDIADYEEKARNIWVKLFGGLAVDGVRVTSTSTLTGLAGGVVGTVLPAASLLESVMAGAFVGAVKEAPALANTIKDFFLERRSVRRNPLAYISLMDRRFGKAS